MASEVRDSLAVTYRATYDAMVRSALWSGTVKLASGGTLGEPSYMPGADVKPASRYGPGVLGPEHLQGHFDWMAANFGAARMIGGQLVGPAVTAG